jgi:ABC-type Fe3+-siderophore transport system permease subunit
MTSLETLLSEFRKSGCSYLDQEHCFAGCLAYFLLFILMPKGKALTQCLMLGEKDAQHLGINVEKLKADCNN